MTATLYHHPLACSTACRIAAAEGGVPLEIARVDVFAKTLPDGSDFHAINPLGQLSALKRDDGTLMTENVSILAWIQDASPSADYRRAPDAPDYFDLIRWLGFTATELHKALLWPQFNAGAPAEMKSFALSLAPKKLAHLDAVLADRDYILGARISAADAYLFWALSLAAFAGADLAPHAAARAYLKRMSERPETARVMAEDRAAAGVAA